MSMLQTDISSLKGVGKSRAQQLNRLGVDTVQDLLKHVPRAYRDLTRLSLIDDMREGEDWFGLLTITSEPKLQYVRRNFSMVKVSAEDDTGSIMLIYYNMPYMKNNLKQGERYYIYGAPSFGYGELRILNPMTDREDVGEGERLLPVYRCTAGLTQRTLRKLIRQCIDDFGMYVEDGLPRTLRERRGLLPSLDAYEMVHFPPDFENKEAGIRSLAVEELLQLKEYLKNSRGADRQASVLVDDGEGDGEFFSRLEYAPTNAQRRVIAQVREDISCNVPMRRLLQGDVGSGKTTVAFYAMYCAAKSGAQAAMLAPTEILAEQHYRNAHAFFEPLGLRVGLLRAGMKKGEQKQALEAIASGGFSIVVGTHSLISERVEFKQLELVVADEQHRFGVEQRARISAKGRSPHMLIMSATPIPRTLALIIYGDLDISVIDEMPAGRKPIETRIVSGSKRADMLKYIAGQVRQGSQAYVVCPLIEEGETGLKSVQQVHKEICNAMPDIEVSLLHGRLKQADKDDAIRRFASGEIGVLVSTTVVEVGVDVPNATTMVIEDAHRFGLAQLHQLRGRVGRGEKQSWCFLTTDDYSNDRLKALCESGDGFEIAQADLEQRGPGQLLGTQQHGKAGLWIMRMLTDASILKEVEQLFSELETPEYAAEKEYIIEKAGAKYAEILKDIALN